MVNRPQAETGNLKQFAGMRSHLIKSVRTPCVHLKAPIDLPKCILTLLQHLADSVQGAQRPPKTKQTPRKKHIDISDSLAGTLDDLKGALKAPRAR